MQKIRKNWVNSEKTALWTDTQTDGQSWIHRTLPTLPGVQKKEEKEKEHILVEYRIYFKGRNFHDFAIFGKIRESLFPRNICYL